MRIEVTSMWLSREDCERIHESALQVLEEVGVRIDDPEIVRLLVDAGGVEAGGDRVRIPRHVVSQALSQCPRSVSTADRSGKLTELGPRRGTLFLTGNALYVTRGHARAELESADLAELARVVEACKNIDGMVGTSIADTAPQCRDFVGFRIMAENTRKHLRPCIYTPRGAKLVMEMAAVLLDGASLRARPIVSTGFSILSPLHWSALALGVFRETAGLGVPVMINSEPLAGATAPVTLAGCLVIGDADVMSGLVINQLLEPGRPCFYNIGFAHVIDMASAIALTGSPENALLQAAGADLAHYHGLPCASWMSTEAMTADEQAAFEKMMMGMAHVLAGANFIWGAGNLESTLAMSPEALVTDDEIAGYCLRLQKSFEVEERTLALDLIRSAALSGDFLTAGHTLENYREVLSRPLLASRSRREEWLSRGGLTFGEAARERVREILDRPEEPCIDAMQLAELRRIETYGMRTLAG
ncbi:MAG: trimethylamine methyltransferase family protein [Acidobacteria bacterium]|nr:trimethylamine methyltransferase family protein [Acidobacteriota bacterium]